MSAPIVIHGFETSNNFKVRVALGYKGIPFEFRRIDPADRTQILELTGQPMTPVMEHGDVRLFDSAAILRYLEANFPDTPRLFSRDYATMREIERWEAFARVRMSAPLLRLVMLRVAGKQIDEDSRRQSTDEFAEVTATLQRRLQDNNWLVGEALTAADVSAGPVVFRVLDHGILPRPEGIDRVVEWADRVMRQDPVLER